jgi:hypothetical protein
MIKYKYKQEGSFMVLADWIVIGILLLCLVIGAIAGFGKVLKFFTSGVFGIIISIVVCYFIYGLVYNLQITQDLLTKFIQVLTDADNTFCNILIKIHIEIVVLVIIMFALVQIVRILIVHLLQRFFEIDKPVFKVINKLFGAVLLFAIAIMLGLIVFQIISWIGGTTASDFALSLNGSLLRLDEVFANNPLVKMINLIKV